MSNMFNKEMVRLRRLELPRVISPQRPQRCASTNSATAAPKGPRAGNWHRPYGMAIAHARRLYPISRRFNQPLFHRISAKILAGPPPPPQCLANPVNWRYH
jgi:hypothetical protein